MKQDFESRQFQFARQGAKMHRIALIDGPNMSNPGRRSKKWPLASIDALHDYVCSYGKNLGVQVETFVSDDEGAAVEFIRDSAWRVNGYLINPAGLTGEGLAVPHALIESNRPYVEMHVSNIETTPGTRRGAPAGPAKSIFSPHVTGLRHYGYIGALVALTLALDDAEFVGAEEETVCTKAVAAE